MKHTSIFAIFRDRAHADSGVAALIESGFRMDDVSVLAAENVGTKDFAHEKHSKAPEGAAAGAIVGLVIGGVLGALAGMGYLALPWLAIFLTAGPVMSALAGVGFGGVVGLLIGGLIGLGKPEFEAKRYAGLIKDGRSLLSVHCENAEWAGRAKDVLKAVGAHDIAAAGEANADYAAHRLRLRYGSR
jgi:hypothetical protein